MTDDTQSILKVFNNLAVPSSLNKFIICNTFLFHLLVANNFCLNDTSEKNIENN